MTRACMAFASKQEVDDSPVEEHEIQANSRLSCAKPPTKYITKNILWKSAKEHQFPNTPDLSFYGDDVAYFIAKGKRFSFFVSHHFEQFSPMLEYNNTLDDIEETIYNSENDIYNWNLPTFEIKYRFLTFYDDLSFQFANMDDTQKFIKRHFNDYPAFIIDLKHSHIRFSNHISLKDGNRNYSLIDTDKDYKDDMKEIYYYGKHYKNLDGFFTKEEDKFRVSPAL